MAQRSGRKVQCQPGIAEIAMLRLLSVTNFATIEQLEMDLASGFNVLTGETGAGKSIIVDALSLLLGGRADGGMVRSGARQSRVEGVFLAQRRSRAENQCCSGRIRD